MTDSGTKGVEITMGQLIAWLDSMAGSTELPVVAAKPLAGVLYHWSRSMEQSIDSVAESLRRSVKKYLDKYDDPDDFGPESGVDPLFEVRCAAFLLEDSLNNSEGYTWPIYDGTHPTMLQTRGTALDAEAALLKLSESLLILGGVDKRIRPAVADATRLLVATIMSGKSASEEAEEFEAGLSISLSKGLGGREAADGRIRGALTSDNLGLTIAASVVLGAPHVALSQNTVAAVLHRILPKLGVPMPDAHPCEEVSVEGDAVSASPAPQRTLRSAPPFTPAQRLSWLGKDQRALGMSQRELAQRAEVKRSRVRRAPAGMPVSEEELIALELVLFWAQHPRSPWTRTTPTSITTSTDERFRRGVVQEERELDALTLTVLAAEKNQSFRKVAHHAGVSPSTLARARACEIDMPHAAWPLVLPALDHATRWAITSVSDDYGVGPEHRLLPVEALLHSYIRGRNGEPIGSAFIAPAQGRRPNHLSLDGVVLGGHPETGYRTPSKFFDLRRGQFAPFSLQPSPGVSSELWLRCYRRRGRPKEASYRDRCTISSNFENAPALAVLDWDARYPKCAPVRLDIKGAALKLGLGPALASYCLSGWVDEVVVRQADVALDVDVAFRKAIVFEDRQHPRRTCQAYLAHGVGSGHTNYVRFGSRRAALHFNAYDRDDARHLPRRLNIPDPPGADLPLRVEAKFRLQRKELMLDADSLAVRLPGFFADIRVLDLTSRPVQSLSPGSLLSLSWIQRHGLTRSSPSLRRLKDSQQRWDAECEARANGTLDALYPGSGLPVLMDAGDIVLATLVRMHAPEKAVELARQWYRAAVALLKVLPSQRFAQSVSEQSWRIAGDLRAIASLR